MVYCLSVWAIVFLGFSAVLYALIRRRTKPSVPRADVAAAALLLSWCSVGVAAIGLFIANRLFAWLMRL